MVKIANAFSINMLPDDFSSAELDIARVGIDYVKALLQDDYESYVGHADTARILSGLLGTEIPYNRASLKLEKGDVLIVAQYVGPRLPEGATQLPEGAKFEFYIVHYDRIY